MKTTQQERDDIRDRAEYGFVCTPGTPSVSWLLRLLDDADRLAEFEAYCAAYKTTPEDIREAFAVMDGKPTRAALEAENEQLRKLARLANEHECAHWPTLEADALLRALLDGGGE